MKIDHVAMYVRDLEVVKDFFVRFFGAVSNEMYHNPRTGLKSYFLSFGNGAKLEIMTRPDLSVLGKDIYRTGLFICRSAWGVRNG